MSRRMHYRLRNSGRLFRQLANTIFAVLFICTGIPLIAQSQSEDISLEDIRQAYQQLEYEQTVAMTEQYLQNNPRLPESDLLSVLQLRAFSQVALGEEDAATQTLRSILVTAPDFTLDSQVASPKVVRLFKEVQQDFEVEETQIDRNLSVVIVEDVQTTALLRSVAFPGLGQIYLEKPRGYIMTGIAATSLGIAVYSTIVAPELHDRYLRATGPQTINSRYDKYNQWYKVRNSALVIYAINWGISIADIAIFGTRKTPNFSVLPTSSGIQLSANIAW